MDRQTGWIAARARAARSRQLWRGAQEDAPSVPRRAWVLANLDLTQIGGRITRVSMGVLGFVGALVLLGQYFSTDPGARGWWIVGVTLVGIWPAIVYSSVWTPAPALPTPLDHAIKTAARAIAWIGAAFVFAAVQYNVQYFLDEAPFTSGAELRVYRNFYEWTVPVVAAAVWVELSRVLAPAKAQPQLVAARRMENLFPRWWRKSEPGDQPVGRAALEIARYWLSPGGVALAVAVSWILVDATVRWLIDIPV